MARLSREVACKTCGGGGLTRVSGMVSIELHQAMPLQLTASLLFTGTNKKCDGKEECELPIRRRRLH